MGERRLERVGQLVQAELARLLQRAVRDPRLQAVTVTGVRMTADLRHARVFFRTLEAVEEHAATLRSLERAAPFLRGEIGRALGMRTVPDLRFEYDDTLDTVRHLDDLFRGLPAGPPADGTDEEGE